jgi:hypothetical protein
MLYFLELKVKFTLNRNSSVGLETAYGLDNRRIGVCIPVKSRVIIYARVQAGSGAHPVSYTNGTGVNRPAHEADHSPPSVSR